VIEGVRKRTEIRVIAHAKARIIRGDKVESIGERLNQIAIAIKKDRRRLEQDNGWDMLVNTLTPNCHRLFGVSVDTVETFCIY